ncbi:MAG: hypothetical protein IPG10_14980 [Flavobacteriales bacterium]|nr:hypothetical protein [Flavobacteriales bacterium]
MRREALYLFLLFTQVQWSAAQSSSYYLDVAGGPAYSFATGTRIVDTYDFTLRDSTLEDGGGVGYQIGAFSRHGPSVRRAVPHGAFSGAAVDQRGDRGERLQR